MDPLLKSSNHNWLNELSPHLFWDTDATSLDPFRDRQFIVKRVLVYGRMSDWQILNSIMSVKEIAEIAAGIRDLDHRSGAFISVLSGKPKKNFRCFTSRQSTRSSWVY
jgi:hypothetical protein